MSRRPPVWTNADKLEERGGTSTQDLPLFARPENRPVGMEAATLEESFRRYHARNPHVLGLIIDAARRLKARGETKAGIALIVEELRHDPSIRVDSPTFKLPNAHRAFYARVAMHRAPDLCGFFDVAAQRTPFDPATV